MSTIIRGLPPRVSLRIKDSATGSYPSVSRTGDDSRRGKYFVLYDDTNTINFVDIPQHPSASLSTKRNPKFNLRQNEGNYQSADGVIHYFQFEEGAEPTVDTGVSGTCTFNYLAASDFTSSHRETPGSGSVFSSGHVGAPNTVTASPEVWSTPTAAIYQAVSESLSLEGVQKTFSCWLNKTDALALTESIIFARSSSVANGYSSDYEFGLMGRNGGDISFSESRTDPYGALFFRSFDTANASIIETYIPSFFINRDVQYGEWWHLAITSIDATTHRFYCNGERVYGELMTGSNISGFVENTVLTNTILGGAGVGSGFAAPVRGWGGIIDDFAVFDRVLGDHEIAEIAGFRRGVSYPVGLDGNSSFSKESERTDILAPGSVRRGISDNFVSFTPGENITPFNESFRPEQNRSDSFYSTGTSPADSGLGFSSKLSSKTQIKLEFEVETQTLMNPTTASIVYLNNSLGEFELAGGDEALCNPAANEERGMSGRDCKLFNAIGMALMSGTGIPASGQSAPSPFHGSIGTTISTDMDSALIFKQEQSVPLNPLFSATDNQTINLSGVLDAPFLLEKAVIELPISCSDGWFSDRTYSLVDGTFTFSDLGGPCVTVSLLNQLAANKREIILSGTIIPSDDNESFSHTGNNAILGPAGFSSFATCNATVKETGPQVVTMEIVPTIANGVLSPTTGGIDFKDAFIGEISPFCRSFDSSDPSARSYFGKEYTIPRFDNTLVKRYDEDTLFGTTAHSDLFIFEKQEVSPYILLPTDELILAVSKYRPAMTNIQSRTSVTGSHDFALDVGTIKMTLYGSLVRENQEFHDSLNQNLTSDSVHEIIHSDGPVVDQFDIESRSSFSGSYIAEFFTGSMLISGAYDTASFFGNGFTDQRRGVRSSIIGTSHTLIDSIPVASTDVDFNISKLGFNRSVSLFSDNERYYDTLLPRPDQISNINNADIVHDTSTGRNFFLIGRGASVVAANWIEDWDFLFPFESTYANVTRTTTPFRNTLSTINTSLIASVLESSDAGLYRPESINNTAGTINSFRVMHGAFINDGSIVHLPVPNDILAKSLFSIGDGQYNEPVGTSLGSSNSIAYDVIPRGFKYGILNSNIERKKWKFRRDRYGQFRDMIEQSKDSKFYIEDNGTVVLSPVQVRFVDGTGDIVDPEETFSSNMSNEATSSLPYFDDISRNRGPLPSTFSI